MLARTALKPRFFPSKNIRVPEGKSLHGITFLVRAGVKIPIIAFYLNEVGNKFILFYSIVYFLIISRM